MKNNLLPAIIFIFVVGLLITFLNCYLNDFEKSVNIAATLIQTIAIMFGGLWAYVKFVWEKRSGDAIKVKTILMSYEKKVISAINGYREKTIGSTVDRKIWGEYLPLINEARDDVVSQVAISLYIENDLRERIIRAIYTIFDPFNGFEGVAGMQDDFTGIYIDIDKLASI